MGREARLAGKTFRERCPVQGVGIGMINNDLHIAGI